MSYPFGDDQAGRIWSYDPAPHGSAAWADAGHLASRDYGPEGDQLLGFLPAEHRKASAIPITYSGDRHALIAAPTRSGKAVSGSVPRLLDHRGSAIVLDIKGGELALITALYRSTILGQPIYLIDPYDEVSTRLGLTPSRLNPMERIDLDAGEPFDEAMLIAEGCVMPDGSKDVHWDAEAAALIAGIALREAEAGRGSLGNVRDALNLDQDSFEAYLDRMSMSPHGLIRAAAGRISQKADRERASVISTAHRNTHFLESRALSESLSASDIDLRKIGDGVTIYIVLPAERIRTARGWLRILIATLINAVTALPERPRLPVLMVLEEMATLGRMDIIEQSFSLMAGYGLQLLAVIQDFSQLRDLYRDRWETFLANAASIQCYGTRDLFTARYLSELCGQASIDTLSHESAYQQAILSGDRNYRSARDGFAARRLITPDELMRLHPAAQVMHLAAAGPVVAWRPAYFLDSRYRDRRGRPLFGIHPHHADKPMPRAIDFAAPGLDLGAALAPYLRVG